MFQHIKVSALGPLLGAEVTGVDFSRPVPDDVCAEIKQAVHQYGVLVFRDTGLDDAGHVRFAARFGPLDSMRVPRAAGVQLRIAAPELTDQSNLDVDGRPLDPGSLRGHFNRGNLLFHVDNSYNHQRARYSILRAAAALPADVAARGGRTEFCDMRAAWDALPAPRQRALRAADHDVWHSIWHSRKLGAPAFFARVDPARYPMARRKLVEPLADGRTALCVPAHCHRVEGLEAGASRALLDELFAHATQPRFVQAVAWRRAGDVVMWDNRVVMHRGTPIEGGGGGGGAPYVRDMRRATVLDEGPGAYSANEMDPAGSWKAMYEVAQLYGAKVG